MATLLVVENDTRLAEVMGRALVREGHDVRLAGSAEQGMRLAGAVPYEGIVIDVSSPGMDGLEVCRRMRRGGLRAPVVVIGVGDDLSDTALRGAGRRPVSVEALLACPTARHGGEGDAAALGRCDLARGYGPGRRGGREHRRGGVPDGGRWARASDRPAGRVRVRACRRRLPSRRFSRGGSPSNGVRPVPLSLRSRARRGTPRERRPSAWPQSWVAASRVDGSRAASREWPTRSSERRTT